MGEAVTVSRAEVDGMVFCAVVALPLLAREGGEAGFGFIEQTNSELVHIGF